MFATRTKEIVRAAKILAGRFDQGEGLSGRFDQGDGAEHPARKVRSRVVGGSRCEGDAGGRLDRAGSTWRGFGMGGLWWCVPLLRGIVANRLEQLSATQPR